MFMDALITSTQWWGKDGTHETKARPREW